MIDKRRALLIGRFQPFHLGHLYAVKFVLEEEKFIYIGVGSALESHTKRNPFTFAERFEMINAALKEYGISSTRYYIFPIPDSEYHSTWVSIVESIIPEFEVVYSNDPLTRVLMRERGYIVKNIPLYKREEYSGEEFRRRVVENGNWRDLIPGSVYKIIVERKLDKRIKDLWKTDKLKHDSK